MVTANHIARLSALAASRVVEVEEEEGERRERTIFREEEDV
jgi:hypothetical protein